MLKFFRKNEKASRWILIIGMTLLLISWLVFDQSSSFVTDMLSGRSTWATTTDGGSISEADHALLQQETRAIGSLGDQTVRALGLDKDPVHWYLLVLEARQAGLVGGESDGRTRLEEVAVANKVPLNNLIGALCRESGLTPTQLFETMAMLNGVDRLVNLITSGPGRLSPARVEQSAASLLAAVSGEIVVIDGINAKVDVAAPTDEQLKAQLATYGTQRLGEGKFGFGYRTLDQVKVEWLTIPAASITAIVEQSPALSNLELRKYYMEHPAEFEDALSAISPTPPTFEGNREKVRAKVLKAACDAKRAEISKFIGDRLQLSMRGIPQVNGYYTLPADWAASRLSFPALGDELATKFAIPNPATTNNGEGMLVITEIDAIPGLGAATTTRFGPQPLKASQIAQAVKELGGKSTLIAQVGVASPVLQNEAGDLFAMRVTEVSQSAAPASVDQVRDALVADINRVARFEKLNASLAAIEKQAADDGITAVATAYGATVAPFTDLRQSDRQFLQYGLKLPGQIPGLGADAEVAKAIVARAMSLPSGRTIRDLPQADRTVVVPAPEKLAVVVARIDSITPMNQGDLPQLVANPRFRSVIAVDQSAGSPVDLFTADALIARHGFALANPRGRSESDESESGSSPDPSPAPAKAGS